MRPAASASRDRRHSRAPRVWYDDPGLDLECRPRLPARGPQSPGAVSCASIARAGASFHFPASSSTRWRHASGGAMSRGAWMEARNDLAQALTIAQPGVHDLERVGVVERGRRREPPAPGTPRRRGWRGGRRWRSTPRTAARCSAWPGCAASAGASTARGPDRARARADARRSGRVAAAGSSRAGGGKESGRRGGVVALARAQPQFADSVVRRQRAAVGRGRICRWVPSGALVPKRSHKLPNHICRYRGMTAEDHEALSASLLRLTARQVALFVALWALLLMVVVGLWHPTPLYTAETRPHWRVRSGRSQS